MRKEIDTKLSIGILIGIVIGCAFLINFMSNYFSIPSVSIPNISLPSFPSIFPPSKPSKIENIKKFASEEEFKAYLEESSVEYYTEELGFGGGRMPMIEEGFALEAPAKGMEEQGVPERVSETNVQVAGIDEPDIVKTDGKEIYFSPGRSYYWRRWIEYIPPEIKGETKIIKAFPPEDLDIETKIDKRGDLLLYKNILVIFSGSKIYGYDVSNTKNPEKKWSIELKDKNYLIGARLYKDKVYLITRTNINVYHPCPIEPLKINDESLEIKCIDIYHPMISVPVDVTYNAMIINPVSGKVENKMSFVGTSDSSVIYMSENGIYITYSYYESILKFFSKFYKEKCSDIIPNWIIEKLEKLQTYDISEAAKLTEFRIIFERYYNSLDRDERLKMENELENRMEDYYKEHKRDVEKTGVVKVGLNDFSITASGNIPGKPLNQFSLDEYNNYLRIAVTIGEGRIWWGIGIGWPRKTANDVYILDKELKQVGALKDLGLEERIYSVRFIQDKGYLVTFRQIDPFFVLDLSDPKNPQVKGELKIPGYSSYLHPIDKNRILGIGKEGAKVKISLFNVENPEEPVEEDKYTLNEYWSDILNTHHAFLLDEKHDVFFLPGSKGGYIFSFENSQLKLVKAVSDIRARRAIYINDYMYIIGDNKIVVLNEIDWKRTKELEL